MIRNSIKQTPAIQMAIYLAKVYLRNNRLFRDMTKKDDVINLTRKSLSKDYTYEEDKGLYVYKPDKNLRIAFDEKPEPLFGEPWTENFPNKNAFAQLVSIYYGRTVFHKLYCAWVDDYRYLIPIPKSRDELKITSLEYKVGSILNHSLSTRDYDQALAVAGIKLLD
jgi:hypothetical protein